MWGGTFHKKYIVFVLQKADTHEVLCRLIWKFHLLPTKNVDVLFLWLFSTQPKVVLLLLWHKAHFFKKVFNLILFLLQNFFFERTVQLNCDNITVMSVALDIEVYVGSICLLFFCNFWSKSNLYVHPMGPHQVSIYFAIRHNKQ